MKQLWLITIYLFFTPIVYSIHEQVHHRIQYQSKILQQKIKEIDSFVHKHIEEKLSEHEENRLHIIQEFLYTWATNYVRVYQPVVLEHIAPEESYNHAIKNIFFISHIFGLDSIERIEEKARKLMDQEAYEHFLEYYYKPDSSAIIIAPNHKAISTLKRCPLFTIHTDWTYKTIEPLVSYINENNNCCAGCIIDNETYYFAALLYKTRGILHCIIADSHNIDRCTNKVLTKILEYFNTKDLS